MVVLFVGELVCFYQNGPVIVLLILIERTFVQNCVYSQVRDYVDK